MKRLWLLPALALTIAPAGCISLLPKAGPAPALYDIRPAVPPAPAAPKTGAAILAVSPPSGSRVHLNTEIAWRRDSLTGFMDGAAWSSRAGDMLQNLLVEALDASGATRGALRTGQGQADLEIQWDVTAFEVVEDARLEARLQGRAKVFDARTRMLLNTLAFDARVPLGDRSRGRAAAALEEAARIGVGQIAAWAPAHTPPARTP